jgi:hypothetical protein
MAQEGGGTGRRYELIHEKGVKSTEANTYRRENQADTGGRDPFPGQSAPSIGLAVPCDQSVCDKGEPTRSYNQPPISSLLGRRTIGARGHWTAWVEIAVRRRSHSRPITLC